MPEDQGKRPEPRPPTVASPPTKGWAYLGHYQVDSGTWKTRYFEFDDKIEPGTLVELEVREQTGALNVRKAPPTSSARFARVVDVLDAGSKATVHEVQEWSTSGYMWARISYGG